MKPVRVKEADGKKLTEAERQRLQAEAERRFVTRFMLGEGPDVAARAAGITALDAGRVFHDRWRQHLAVIAKAAASSVTVAERHLAARRATHSGRVAELVYLAQMDEEARQRRPDAPTAQRLAMGDMRQGVAKSPDDPRGKAEVRVWVSGKPTPVHDAYERGQITARQLEAAQRIEALAYVAFGSGVSRSCIDMTPAGSNGDGAAQAAASADYHAVSVAMGEARDACLGVVVFHQATGERAMNRRRWVRVLTGLDIAGDFFGLPRDDA